MNIRGVSPVVGSVLLIVLTVTIAAIVATVVLPLVRDNLDESGACLDVFNKIEFAESKFNCWNESYDSSGNLLVTETGFSIKVDKEEIHGFRISFIDDTTGSSEILNVDKDTTSLSNLRMVGDGANVYGGALSFPDVGGQRSYVIMNRYDIAEIAAVLKSGQVCNVADRIDINHCTSDVTL